LACAELAWSEVMIKAAGLCSKAGGQCRRQLCHHRQQHMPPAWLGSCRFVGWMAAAQHSRCTARQVQHMPPCTLGRGAGREHSSFIRKKGMTAQQRRSDSRINTKISMRMQ
jgi:hypothetical protein